MRCNNHDDLLHLGFALKFSLFSGAFKTEFTIYDGVFCENNKLLTKKSFIIDVGLGSKYASAFICERV